MFATLLFLQFVEIPAGCCWHDMRAYGTGRRRGQGREQQIKGEGWKRGGGGGGWETKKDKTLREGDREYSVGQTRMCNLYILNINKREVLYVMIHNRHLAFKMNTHTHTHTHTHAHTYKRMRARAHTHTHTSWAQLYAEDWPPWDVSSVIRMSSAICCRSDSGTLRRLTLPEPPRGDELLPGSGDVASNPRGRFLLDVTFLSMGNSKVTSAVLVVPFGDATSCFCF